MTFSRGLILVFVGAAIAAIPTMLSEQRDVATITLTWTGVVLSVVGGILQEYDGRPYVLKFTPADWQQTSNSYFIDIPRRTHRKGQAGIAEIYTLTSSGRYAVCMCDVQRNETGDCRVEINGGPFEGRIVIT